jgi:hypothetical protein
MNYTILTSFNQTYWTEFDHNNIEQESGGFSK